MEEFGADSTTRPMGGGTMTGSHIALVPGIVALLALPALAGFPVAPVLTLTDAGPAPPLRMSVLLDHPVSANGWILAVCHDPAGLAVESVGLGAVGSTVNGGAPPDYFDANILADGWTLGVVVSLTGTHVLPAGTDLEIGEVLYSGVSDGIWPACTCTISAPLPYTTVIVYSGASIAPPPECGTVEVDLALVHQFRRGDANIDGSVDIADPIHVLEHLFSAGPAPPCRAAGDADADGSQDIGDVIRLLSFLFSGGPPPAPPFPGCGTVPAADCDVPSCP
jgi:hypothetical protein